MSNVEKWRKLLDCGEAVMDEENAADFLEEVQQYFWNKEDYRGPTIFIPTFRRLLSKAKLTFNPQFTLDKPTTYSSWTKELVEGFAGTSGIDIQSEIVNVLSIDLEQRFKEMGNDLVINFQLTETDVSFFLKVKE
jgi:hypothetical protein